MIYLKNSCQDLLSTNNAIHDPQSPQFNQTMKYFWTLAFIFAFIYSTQAQNSPFLILAWSGQVKINADSAGKADAIQQNDTLYLPENSYVALIHSSGKYAEINQKGSYTSQELEKLLSANILFDSSDIAILLDTALANEKWGTKNSTLRCGECIGRISFSEALNHIQLYGDKWFLSWDFYKGEPDNKYLITASDLMMNKHYQKELSENHFLGSTNEKVVFLTIELLKNKKDNPLMEIVIKKINRRAYPQLTELNQLLETDPSPTLGYLALAIAFEKNKLPIDAYFAYQKLIEAYPDVVIYRHFLEEFSERHLLKIE